MCLSVAIREASSIGIAMSILSSRMLSIHRFFSLPFPFPRNHVCSHIIVHCVSKQRPTIDFRFRFRFNRIVDRRLKITKFTANRKNIKIECNRQQANAKMRYITYGRLWCGPEFRVAAGLVVLVTSIQQTYHNRTTKHTYSIQTRNLGTFFITLYNI